jgi:8-oxo-dGTP diphosphatase
VNGRIKSTAPRIWAAGGVVHRADDEGTNEYLLVHRPRYDDWSLPKGKIDRGEGFLEAALREVREETGIQGDEPRPLGTIAYETTAGNRKAVRWWLLSAAGGSFRDNGEVDKVRWLPAKKAKRRLTYRNDRNVLGRADALVDDPSRSTIYLVRHCWAGIKATYRGSDKKRPVDRRGRTQAVGLYRELRSLPINRIVSSDTRRCHQSIDPLRKGLGIPVSTDPRLAVDRSAKHLADLVESIQGEAVVLCTHGELIGDYVRGLAADGRELDGPEQWKKGSAWILQARQGWVRSGRYVEPRG